MSSRPDTRPRSHSPPLASTPATPRDQNARRLQLRHAGFRGSTLPGHRRTPLQSNDDLSTTPTTTPPSLHGTGVSPPEDYHLSRRREGARSGRILREISNFATTQRVASNTSLPDSRPSLGAMDGLNNDENVLPAGQVYVDDASNANSLYPATPVHHPSGSSQKLVRRARKSSQSLRSTSSGANRYIDHLESELTSLHSKLDSLTSPTSGRAHSARIRGLSKQTQSLREELAQWEQRFEERVEDEVFARTHIEAELQKTIRGLEEELNAKDLRSRDLERELDAVQTKLDASRALESNLGRRIDVLTGLLAQSPTRESTFAEPALGAAPILNKTPRPRSLMLPRLNAPLEGHELFQAQALEPESSNLLSEGEAQGDNLLPQTENGFTHAARQQSISSTAQSSAIPSTHTDSPFSSRPVSLLSTSSVASSWGIPLLPEPRTKTDSGSKKMRRFMSGSTTLKPLLLTSATGASGTPASATLEQSSSPLYPTSPSSPSLIASERGSSPLGFPRTYRESVSPDPEDGCRRSADRTDDRDNLWSELERARRDTTASPEGEPEFFSPPDSIRTLRFQAPCTSLNEMVMDDSPSLSRRHANRMVSSISSSTGTRLSHAEQGLSPPPLRIKRSSTGLSNPPIPGNAIARIAGLMASFRYRAIVSVKNILLQSWIRGSSNFSGLGWWLIGLASRSGHTLGPLKASRSVPEANGSGTTIDADPFANDLVRRNWPTLFPGNPGCRDCAEPPSRRSLRMWFKFSLAMVLAIGIAVLEGPGALIQADSAAAELRGSSVQLAYRRGSEELTNDVERKASESVC